MTTRRETLALLASAPALFPIAGWAQQPGTFKIGWISLDHPDESPFYEPLRAGLRDLGYVEGKNLELLPRWAGGAPERLDALAADLVSQNPRIIITQGPSARAVRKASAVIPLVFGLSGDPVESGLVESLARPGGNNTGVSFLSLELVGKRMQMLKELAPAIRRVAILTRPDHPGEKRELQASQAAAKLLGLEVTYFPIVKPGDLNEALALMPKSRMEAIDVFPDAIMLRNSDQIAAYSIKHKVPAISGWSQFADRGNIITYGPNLRDCFRRLAYYIDRILKGAKPADLPVELPTTVEMVLNLKTAKALGITIPQSILVRANRVIE